MIPIRFFTNKGNGVAVYNFFAVMGANMNIIFRSVRKRLLFCDYYSFLTAKYVVPIIFLVLLIMYPFFIRANENDVVIDKVFLQKHLPKLKNPRPMSVEDVPAVEEKIILSEEQTLYKKCSFIITGDFNKDGRTDYAVIGKYDGPFANDSIFIAIFSRTNTVIKLDYLYKLTYPHDRGFLCITSGEKMNIPKINKQYDVIVVVLAVDTDNGFTLAWNGRQYIRIKDIRWADTR